MQHWYVLRAEPQREAVAAAHLIGRRFETYLPMVRQAGRRGRTRQRCELLRPMMPGYLLALLDPQAGQWNRVRSVPGILSFLQFDGCKAMLSDQAVQQLRNTEAELNEPSRKGPLHPFRPGDRVRTTDAAGVWAGFMGVVERLDKRDQVILSLVLPSREWPIVTSATWLELAS